MITGRSALRRLTSCSRPSPSMPGMLMSDSARAQTVESARLDWIANSSRLPERGDSVNVADEQDALFVDAWIPQTIRWWVARKFCPDLIELLGNALAAGLQFALFTLDRAFELNPVIGVIGIDDQDRDLGVFADPVTFGPMRGRIDQYLIALVVEPHRRQADSPIWPD